MIERTEGRDQIASMAATKIEELKSTLSESLRDDKGGLLLLLSTYPTILSQMAIGNHLTEQIVVKYDPTWLKTANSLSFALNEILPDLIPLENLERIEKDRIPENDKLLSLLVQLIDLGKWIYVVLNPDITGLETTDGSPTGGFYKGQLQCLQEYVNAAASDIEGLELVGRLQHELLTTKEFVDKMNNESKRRYGLDIRDIAWASDFLRLIVRNKGLLVDQGYLKTEFRINLGPNYLETYNFLLFKRGKSLERAPLIPVKGDSVLVAGWIFVLGTHYDQIARPLIESGSTGGSYATALGRMFERYITSILEEKSITSRHNVFIRSKNFPEIKSYLPLIGKSDGFEIDVVAYGVNAVYLISCKGAKRSLPKMDVAKKWAEFPEKEIMQRIEECKEEMNEIETEAECIKNQSSVSTFFEIEGRKVVPLLVYPSPQPLSFQKIREEFKIKSQVSVTTPLGLIKIISSSH